VSIKGDQATLLHILYHIHILVLYWLSWKLELRWTRKKQITMTQRACTVFIHQFHLNF